MIRRLRLLNFKNMQDAEWMLGPYTILIGTNASGKSNLRDALRFLHGVARGYSLADVIGGHYEGGALVWEGIRGGPKEIAYWGTKFFRLDVDFILSSNPAEIGEYSIEVQPIGPNGFPVIVAETLKDPEGLVFSFRFDPNTGKMELHQDSRIRQYIQGSEDLFPTEHSQLNVDLRRSRAFGMVVLNAPVRLRAHIASIDELKDIFLGMRFINPDVEALRRPSTPGQNILGDHGEYFSTVLQAIFKEPSRRNSFIEWLKELTPMDVKGFKFLDYPDGKVAVALVEENDKEVSVASASDGTLRFLALLATLLVPEPPRFLFLEEIENGIHPTRLHLLIDLIEKTVSNGKIQVVTTTHSPQLIRLLSQHSVEAASLTYRLPGETQAHIKRLLDLPEDGRKVVLKNDIGRLFESGWFEDVADYLSGGKE